MIFPNFSQNTPKGKESIYEKTPGKIWTFTNLPSICMKDPGKNTNPVMWFSEMEGGRGARITVRCSLDRAEEGEERGLGVMYDRSTTRVGVRRRRRRGHRGMAVH
jgi:hypothetical protein